MASYGKDYAPRAFRGSSDSRGLTPEKEAQMAEALGVATQAEAPIAHPQAVKTKEPRRVVVPEPSAEKKVKTTVGEGLPEAKAKKPKRGAVSFKKLLELCPNHKIYLAKLSEALDVDQSSVLRQGLVELWERKSATGIVAPV